jgi:serine/threonine-protein kinase
MRRVFPQVFGKYVLERELASGGMAVVYLATLRGAGGFEKRLVVKQIRAELASDDVFVHRFVAEAKTTVELSHPNIVPVYELGVEQGVYYIAMELAHGVTLSELLKQDRKLSPEEGAYLGVEICRALDYAHRRSGIVHRDVTPRNVLIDDEGAVRLIDFGIAAPVSVDGSPRERVYGSPGHMPLEQLKGGRLTPATDVFAVGALLFEAWTGRPPFRRATRAESDVALSLPREPLSKDARELAPLDELVARAIAEEASDRPQTAEDLARPLREFLRSADLGDIARRLGERVRRARRASLAGTEGEAVLTPATPPMRVATRPSAPPPPVTPATRPLTQPVTETFALRDEVEEWIGSPSIPPPADSVESAHSADTRRETSVARASWRFIAPVAAVVAVTLAGTLAIKNAGNGAPDHVTARAAVPVHTTAVEPPLVAPSSTSTRSGAFMPERAAVVPTDAGAARAPLGKTTNVSSADEGPKASATLSVTSDLPARVTIDGVAAGTTPLRALKRAPGRHVVGVVSIELDERLTATVDATSGAALAVHAEFTRPVPVLRVR